MHRMSDGRGVVDDQSYGIVAAGVVHVPFRAVGVGDVAVFGEEQKGAVVVGAEGGVVHRPEEVASGVYVDGDVDEDGGCGVGVRCDGVIWDCVCQGVLRRVSVINLIG